MGRIWDRGGKNCRSTNDLIADNLLVWSDVWMSGNPSYNALQNEVCVECGWCGGIVDGKTSHVDNFIPEAGPVSADQFVDWLFLAEGMDPSEDPEKWQASKEDLRHAFIRHMGAEIVDASMLQWDVG